MYLNYTTAIRTLPERLGQNKNLKIQIEIYDFCGLFYQQQTVNAFLYVLCSLDQHDLLHALPRAPPITVGKACAHSMVVVFI